MSVAFDPPLITNQVYQDASVGRAPPYFAFLPVATLDLAFHGLDGIARQKVRQRQQDVPSWRQNDGRLTVHGDVGSTNVEDVPCKAAMSAAGRDSRTDTSERWRRTRAADDAENGLAGAV